MAKKTVYDPGCYICTDPEYERMGLPLCRPCPKCGAHTAADDDICEACNTELFNYDPAAEMTEEEYFAE